MKYLTSRQEEQRVSGGRQNGKPEEVEESPWLWKGRKSRGSREGYGLRGTWRDRQKLHTLGSSRSCTEFCLYPKNPNIFKRDMIQSY